ncbi:rhodanese-like domain-containing protein [Bdellovibrio svalbardensis]|uniref:Rhodanese-like domain-containing protein n=1 Tax=Bdellovibrio svalbardensis TaxID=2972972 RepID=A0ABT6DMP6_9BACT|nr:rhodanese-like domain-containing protein [Bdellovibrio svalbardensis]MDG0818142.1 rhodanese-like domain-containing protein [Bdellovibrio svalbardensis]
MKNLFLVLLLAFTGFHSWAEAKEVLLDVRTPEEYSEGHIPQAINIDVKNQNFKTEVAKLDREDSYKVYCRSGKRSQQAVGIMKDLGFKHLENLGGLEEAKKALKVETLTK